MTYDLKHTVFILLSVLYLCGCEKPAGEEARDKYANKNKESEARQLQYVTLSGDSVLTPENPSDKAFSQYEEARTIYESNKDSADLLIWYGRRAAYIGKYQTAIDLFTKGINQFPDDARFYRHRGHRFLTTRRFSAAVADFEKAAQLIKGTEDRIEPDGIPNTRNTPVSSLQSNIWYHLGLAYYLQNDLENALRSYREGEKVSVNNDMIVSNTHWLYMTLRRMRRDEEAQQTLKGITSDMDIIENDSYHDLNLFYKGEIKEEDLNGTESGNPSNDAVLYGLASWHLYNDNRDEVKRYLEKILDKGNKASFGYIAAEADYVREFK